MVCLDLAFLEARLTGWSHSRGSDGVHRRAGRKQHGGARRRPVPAGRPGGRADRASLWKATDELLRRPVAVYVLAPGVPAAGLSAAVRAAASISDPRLARIFDADYGAGCPHIVAEWAPGEHVEDLLLTGPPSPALSAAIVADAADALAVAPAG